MNIGFMIADFDPKKSMTDRINYAVQAYLRRFKREPEICYIHISSPDVEIPGLRIEKVINVMPYHVLAE